MYVAIGNWFCGVTQPFYKQGGHWSEQAQQANTSCWNMGTGRRENGGTEKKCGEQEEGERRRVKECFGGNLPGSIQVERYSDFS